MHSKRFQFIAFNFIGLEITWAACAYGASNAMPWIGVVVGTFYLLIHFSFTQNVMRDLIVVGIVGCTGALVDSLNTLNGILQFDPKPELFPIPFWLVILWFVFALAVPYCLYWFHKNLWLAAFAGFIGGGGSYWVGHIVDALQFDVTVPIGLIIIGVEWALLFPLFLVFVMRMESAQ